MIRKCTPPNDSVFWGSSDGDYDGWPQWNDDQEKELRRELQAICNLSTKEARKKLLDLEIKHGHRRRLVWAELGQSPMAMAMKHLAVLADRTSKNLAAGSVIDLTVGYRNYGWQADDAVMRALEQVESNADFEPICTAICTVYMPWAEESARHLQKIWNPSDKTPALHKQSMAHDCILFVDGLRYDIARRLTLLLESKGLAVDQSDCWAALPSVTGTGKPAVAPLHNYKDLVAEEAGGFNFEILTSYHLNKAIEKSGYHILDKKTAIGTSAKTEKAWCEYGDIDHEGHDRGWKLARHINMILSEISERINALFDAGWDTVHIVSDHGWLLIPQGLPKTELPAALVETKWGRCAALKPGAKTEEPLYPWYWNPNQQFALAGGICCFKKNLEFAHGGLSLQECLIPRLTVCRASGDASAALIEITDIVWKGMRCTISVDTSFEGLSTDIRLQAGDPSSSVVVGVKKLKNNGTASMVLLTDHFGLVSDFISECWSQLRNQSRVSLLQNRVFFGGALSGRDTNAVNKTISGLLKLLYPGDTGTIPEEDIEWAVRIALEARRRVKEQQKRIGAAEFRNTHFSYVMGTDGVEKFVSTPELQSDNSIGTDPLEPGQAWGISPGSGEEYPGLFRIEINEGPGSGIKILNKPVPPAFKECIGYAEQNLYARAKQLVGDKEPRHHEFTVQLRAFDSAKSGAKLGIAALVALCTALLKKSIRGGLIIVGDINLGGSIEPIHNPVPIAEIAVEKGATALLMPVSCRRQLFDLSDEMATKVDIQFYSDARDALLKAIVE